MTNKDKNILKHFGWIVVCESPLKIESNDLTTCMTSGVAKSFISGLKKSINDEVNNERKSKRNISI